MCVLGVFACFCCMCAVEPFLDMATSRLRVCWWYTCCQATEHCSQHCSGSGTELPCGLRSEEWCAGLCMSMTPLVCVGMLCRVSGGGGVLPPLLLYYQGQ